ncbi:MAG: type II toxin-antitoxin system RelE/ParE family toxin [Chloroflexota bacterium]|nr:type II toxin-antitoxin system RelE/ParE family toxin [Chloroflexota bacterium]
MAYRYEFGAAAARDLEKLTRRNHALLMALVTTHIPALLADPLAAGEKKKGHLAHVRAYPFKADNVAYRLVYQVEEDVVTLLAIGPHDEAYAKAARRR